MTDALSKHFPQYKFAQGKDAEVKKVINNSKVQQTAALCSHLMMLNWWHVKSPCKSLVCYAAHT